MKQKHIEIRVEQCLALAKASNCPRLKVGALLLDPVRNVILMDGYNGGPRGGGNLCGGERCLRDGFEGLKVIEGKNSWEIRDRSGGLVRLVAFTTVDPSEGYQEAVRLKDQFEEDNPPIKSGTCIEIGCHHAEMNVVCNVAASHTSSAGAWLIVTGEPCMLCAKFIHHAGIVKVLVVKGGYMGANGVEYLRAHGVEVQEVDGPKDPRSTHDGAAKSKTS